MGFRDLLLYPELTHIGSTLNCRVGITLEDFQVSEIRLEGGATKSDSSLFFPRPFFKYRHPWVLLNRTGYARGGTEHYNPFAYTVTQPAKVPAQLAVLCSGPGIGKVEGAMRKCRLCLLTVLLTTKVDDDRSTGNRDPQSTLGSSRHPLLHRLF